MSKGGRSRNPIVVKPGALGPRPVWRDTIAAKQAPGRRAGPNRIQGIVGAHKDMLSMVGVKSIQHLSEAQPELLHRVLLDFNSAQGLANRAPTLEQVELWINSAKKIQTSLGKKGPTHGR